MAILGGLLLVLLAGVVLLVLLAFWAQNRAEQRELREYESSRGERQHPITRTFRFEGGLPPALLVDNPILKLRDLAQEHHPRQIEVHQLTDILHETIPEPREGSLIVGSRRAEEVVHVTVEDFRVELQSPRRCALHDAVALVLSGLGGSEEVGSASRFRSPEIRLTVHGARFARRLGHVCEGPSGQVWAIDQEGVIFRLRDDHFQRHLQAPLKSPWGMWVDRAGRFWVWAESGLVSGDDLAGFARVPLRMLEGETLEVHGLWGDPTDLWAIGRASPSTHEVIARRAGDGLWTREPAPVPEPSALRQYGRLRGFASGRLWAVGDHGTIVRREGTPWKRIDSGTNESLKDVLDAGAVTYVVGWDVILRCEGDRVTKVPWREETGYASATVCFDAVWGTAENDVWVCGGSDMGRIVVLHFDGARWRGGDISLGGYDVLHVSMIEDDGGRPGRLVLDDGRWLRLASEPGGPYRGTGRTG